MKSLVLGSFNIKNEYNKRFDKNKVETLFKMFNDYSIDVLGLQEVTKSLLIEIKKTFEANGYFIFASSRTKYKRSVFNEFNVIISRHKILDCKTYWLSRKPSKIGSKSYFSAYPRSVNIVEINVDNIGVINFINTHLDIFKHARRKQLDKLYDIMKDIKGSIVLTGDFNVTSDKDYFIDFCNKLKELGIERVLNDKETFKYSKKSHYIGPIDYIFVSNSFNSKEVIIIDTDVSDHMAIVSKTEYNK
jgi:endonuclease/exonuclease/phosphatase family metal-dependent hydrolase